MGCYRRLTRFVNRYTKRLYLLLAAVFLFQFVANTATCVPELVVVGVMLTLSYARQAGSWWDFLYLYVVLVVSSSLTIASEFHHPDMNWTWAATMLLLQLPLQMLFVLPYVADKVLLGVPLAHALAFPTSYTGIQVLLVYVSPGGSWGVAGYCASYDTPRIIALLSLAGLSGVHFLLSFAACCFITCLGSIGGDDWGGEYEDDEDEDTGYMPLPVGADGSGDFSEDPNLDLSCESLPHGATSPHHINNSLDTADAYDTYPQAPTRTRGSASVRARVHPLRLRRHLLFLLLLLLVLYGSFYSSMPTLMGVQDDRKVLPISCITVANDHLVTQGELLALTRVAAETSRVVLWSERPMSVEKSEETTLQRDAVALGLATNTFIGVTYELRSRNQGETSRFALVDPDGNGSIALQVGRVHTSPFGKGPGRSASVVRAVDTSIGKIGGIMGFDLNFPQFVREVAADGVRLALVPAEDYGPIYALQWNQASLRAAAEGTTVVYCSSMYGLLVVDPYGSTVLRVPTPKDKTVAVLSGMIPLAEVTTPYSVMGDLFGFLCLAISALVLITGKAQIPNSNRNVASWLMSLWERERRLRPSNHGSTATHSRKDDAQHSFG